MIDFYTKRLPPDLERGLVKLYCFNISEQHPKCVNVPFFKCDYCRSVLFLTSLKKHYKWLAKEIFKAFTCIHISQYYR